MFLKRQFQSTDSDSDADKQFTNEILSLPLLQKYFVNNEDEASFQKNEQNEDWSLRCLTLLKPE